MQTSRSSSSMTLCDAHHDADTGPLEEKKVSDLAKAEAADLQPCADDQHDPFLVSWDGEDDPANPRNLPFVRKWMISMLGAAFCGCVSIVVSGYSISIGSLQRDLDCSREVALLGVSMFTITFGCAPLLLAPLSEEFGRHPLYLSSAVLFSAFILAQALAPNIQTVLVARFICGIGGSTGVAIVGGSLADVWNDKERSLPMNIFAWSAFFTTGLGPVTFGFVEERVGWRYCQWAMFGLSALLIIFVVFVSKETRASVILKRKARRKRKETGDNRYYAAAELHKQTFRTLVTVALLRPLRMLFTEPVVAAFCTWLAFAWTVLYIALIALPLILERVYGFSIAQVGLAFNTQIVGSFCALFITIYCDRLYVRNVARLGPEARLYPALVAAWLFPVGMWIFAFSPNENVPWIVMLIGATIVYTALQLCYVSCFNYLAQCYSIYAASALSAQTFLRNTSGSASPLFVTQMYNAMGIHPASAMLAGVATLLSVTPYLLFHYGERLRQRSPFAVALAPEQQAPSPARSTTPDEKA